MNLLLLNCGPSLKDYSKEQIASFAKKNNCKIGAVKLAYYKIPQLINFHWFNCCNLPPPKNGQFYQYEEGRPDKVIVSSNYAKYIRIGEKQDLDTFYITPFIPENEYLVYSKEFDKNIDTPIKTVGPGIMLESVLPTIVEEGVENLYVIGWDLRKAGEKYEHGWQSEDSLYIPGYPPRS